MATPNYKELIFDYLVLNNDKYFSFEQIRNDLDDKIGLLTRERRKKLYDSFLTLNESYSNIKYSYGYVNNELQKTVCFSTNEVPEKQKLEIKNIIKMNRSEVPCYINDIIDEYGAESLDPFYDIDDEHSLLYYLFDSSGVEYNVTEDRICNVYEKLINNNINLIRKNADRNIKKLEKLKKILQQFDNDIAIELESKIKLLEKELEQELVENLKYENERLREELGWKKFWYELSLIGMNAFWLSVLYSVWK